MRQSKLVVLPLDGYRELCLNAKKAAQSECDKLQDSAPTSSITDNSTASVADTVTEPPTPALPDSTSNNGGSSPQPPVGTTDSTLDGTTPPSIPSKPTTPASLDSTSKTSTHTGPVDSTPTRPTDTPTTVNDADNDDKESSLGRPRAFYINIVRKALSSAYQRQGYAFLLKLKSYSDFSLTDDGTIQIKGIDLEPFNVTTLLRIAFLKFHQGEIPFELQEWLKNKQIQFPTSKIKLRPKFQPKYQLRTSTLAKTREA